MERHSKRRGASAARVDEEAKNGEWGDAGCAKGHARSTRANALYTGMPASASYSRAKSTFDSGQ